MVLSRRDWLWLKGRMGTGLWPRWTSQCMEVVVTENDGEGSFRWSSLSVLLIPSKN